MEEIQKDTVQTSKSWDIYLEHESVVPGGSVIKNSYTFTFKEDVSSSKALDIVEEHYRNKKRNIIFARIIGISNPGG